VTRFWFWIQHDDQQTIFDHQHSNLFVVRYYILLIHYQLEQAPDNFYKIQLFIEEFFFLICSMKRPTQQLMYSSCCVSFSFKFFYLLFFFSFCAKECDDVL